MADVVNTRTTVGNHETLSSLVGATLSELIDDQIYDLRAYAFYGDTGLEAVTLPNIRQAGQYAFASCSRLATVNLGYLHILNSYLFQNCTNLDTVYAAETETAQSACFAGCTNLVTIYMPELLSLANSMFQNCAKLTDVYVPKLKSGNNSAFAGCSSLEEIDLHNLTSVSQYMFQSCTKLRNVILSENCTSIGYASFIGCTSLTEMSFQNVRSLGAYCFQSCTSLETVSLPKATTIGSYAFYGCTKLKNLDIPLVTTVGGNAFHNVPTASLKLPAVINTSGYMTYDDGAYEVEFGTKTTLGSLCLAGDRNLFSVILRNEKLSNLSSTNAFANTPLGAGYGWIYVPDELLDTYKAATNWSSYEDQILPLSDYPQLVTGTIKDSWASIFTAEANGTYRTKYHVNDTMILQIGGKDYLLRIIGIDKDYKADGTGKAPITWMTVGTWPTVRQMHNNYNTATKYHWGMTQLRTYLRDTIMPMIDPDVSSHILEVSKTSRSLTGLNSLGTVESTETLFLPSVHELGIENAYESGPTYSDVFPDEESRRMVRYEFATGASNEFWWTRSAGGGGNQFCFSAVNGVHNYTVDNVTYRSQGGEISDAASGNSYCFPICFCT